MRGGGGRRQRIWSGVVAAPRDPERNEGSSPVVFRYSPDGDGFATTTWPSLARIFALSLIAAAVSVIAASTLSPGVKQSKLGVHLGSTR